MLVILNLLSPCLVVPAESMKYVEAKRADLDLKK